MTTRVVNLRSGLPFDIKGDRSSPFGNPFYCGPDGTRTEVIAKFLPYFLRRPDVLERLAEVRGKTLACWCKPKPCHLDHVARLADMPLPELMEMIRQHGGSAVARVPR